MLVEKFRLLKETSTADNKTLLQAIDELCFTTYERFKKFLQRANVDYSLREYMDPVTQTLCQEVSSVRFPDAPPRQFCSPTDRCNCAERVAEEDMCVHEIKARKGYISSLFLPRHMFRERIYGSLKGWVKVKPDSSNIDKMLGYVPEHMNPDETTVAVAGAISDINEMDASKYSICSGIGPVSALSTSSTGITGAQVSQELYHYLQLQLLLNFSTYSHSLPPIDHSFGTAVNIISIMVHDDDSFYYLKVQHSLSRQSIPHRNSSDTAWCHYFELRRVYRIYSTARPNLS